MKTLRVLVLVHEQLIPPETMEGHSDEEIAKWKTEFDVVATLRDMGHDVRPLGVWGDLTPIREAILEWKPHIIFMLLEEFYGVATYDQHVVSYLELMRQPYTGCNPRGLMVTHDKALTKKILTYHRILTPKFAVFPIGKTVRRPRRLNFPLFVKSVTEHASMGIAQASVVHDDEKLRERVAFIHENVQSHAMAEEYIDGRELYVGVIGNQRLQTFPVWEMVFSKMPEHLPQIATVHVKFNPRYQKLRGIRTRPAKELPPGAEEKLAKLSKRVYRVLDMSGYGRMDFRLSPDGRIYVLEANANPNLEYGEDFAESAETMGIPYESLLQRIINLGLRHAATWKR